MHYKLPTRKKDSHKGEVGKVIIVGGSDRYYGAPILSALGAEKSGADLINLVLPSQHIEAAKSYSLNLFLKSYIKQDLSLEDVDGIVNLAVKNHAMLIGPGIGDNSETKEAVLEILKRSSCPIVIDAQALIPEILEISKKSNWIITPHKQEFKRVFNCDADKQNIIAVAKEYKINILLKGATDIIVDDNGEVSENARGCPEMRVGGTGDVLAGIVTSWVAQGMSCMEACVGACYYFCAAAEAFRKRQRYFSAHDLVKFFPRFLKSR